ncbi:MAG: Npt1/Npt2 family nucleotide transporter [Candidatus Latescibacterota bacterium]
MVDLPPPSPRLGRLRRRVLYSALRVQAGEGVRVGLMLLYSLCAVGGVIVTGQLASRALFLSSLPPSAVPYKFILPPLALVAVSALYTRLAGHCRLERLILSSSAAILAGTALFRLVLGSAPQHPFAVMSALFVFTDVASSLVILQFWSFAGEVFNPREAKRLFSLISGGSAISNILFGALLASIATRVRPENLLYIVMASLVLSMVCVRFLARRYGHVLAEATPAERAGATPLSGSLRGDVRQVLREPLVAAMGGILLAVAVASSIADYQLDLGLQERYATDSQGMVSFLSQFRLWAGVGAGILQFFLAGRLLERFGVVAALLLLPTGMACGAGAILVAGGVLWAAAMPRACDVVLKYTANDAAFNLLYLPVEARLRGKARAVLDGILKPPVVSLLGLVFLWAGQRGSATVVHWAWVLLGLAGVWALLVREVGRQYVTALSQSIRLRRLDPDREKMELGDESSVRVIRQTLQAPDAGRVLHALSLLPRLRRVDWTPHVVLLLDHPDPEVRVLALRYLADEQAVLYADEVFTRLQDPCEEVRAAAVEALCALGKHQVIPRVLAFLEDPSPRIRSAAVLGLVKHTGLDGFLHAGEHLKALLGSPNARARLEGVRVLEELQVPTFYHPLIPLLEDPSIEVQVATIRAAGRIRAPELVAHLVPKLEHPLTRWYATEALARSLGEDLEALEHLLQDPGQSPTVRRQLVAVLQQQHSPRAVELLMAVVEADDDVLRGRVYEALIELRDRGLPVHARPLRAVLVAEVQRAYEHGAVQRQVGPTHALLAEALAARTHQATDRVLALLDLLYPELSCTWMRKSLYGGSARLHATALELIDNVVERQSRDVVLPLLGGAEEERERVAREAFFVGARGPGEHLRQLAHSPDAWLRSCALHAIGEGRLEALADVVQQAVDDPQPLVCQTARAAQARVCSPGPTAAGQRLLDAQPPGGRPPASPGAGEKDAAMALSTLEKVFFLKSASLFAQIPGEDIVGLVPILHEICVPRGETFIRDGEEGDCLYIVVTGEVHVRTSDGREYTIRSREVIGERAVLTLQPRSATCTALTDVVALRIDKDDFWKLMEEQPKITMEVLKVVVERYV